MLCFINKRSVCYFVSIILNDVCCSINLFNNNKIEKIKNKLKNEIQVISPVVIVPKLNNSKLLVLNCNDSSSPMIINPKYISDFNRDDRLKNIDDIYDYISKNRFDVNPKKLSKYGDVGVIFNNLYLKKINNDIGLNKIIDFNIFKNILESATRILLTKKAAILLQNDNIEEVIFVGDFHGHIGNQFLNVIKTLKKSKNNLVVFTGDFLHRGFNQVEIIFFISYLLLLFEEQIIILSGNHELADLQSWCPGGSNINLNVELLYKYRLEFEYSNYPNSLCGKQNFVVNFLDSLSIIFAIKRNNKYTMACHAFPIDYLVYCNIKNNSKNLMNLFNEVNFVFNKSKENIFKKYFDSRGVYLHPSYLKENYIFKNEMKDKFIEEMKKYCVYENGNYFGFLKENFNIFWSNVYCVGKGIMRNNSNNIPYYGALKIMEDNQIERIIHGHQHDLEIDDFKDGIIYTVNSYVKNSINKKFGSLTINFKNDDIISNLNEFK